MTAFPWLAFLSRSVGKTCLQSHAHAYRFFSCRISWPRYKGEKKLSNKYSIFIILHQAANLRLLHKMKRLTQGEIQHLLEFFLSFFCSSRLTPVLEMLLSSFLMLPQLVFSNQALQYMNISLFPAP